MKTPLFLIFAVCIFSTFSRGIYAACTIEVGPPEELVEYVTRTRTELSQIRSQAGSMNRCNGKIGSFSSERQFLEILKRTDEPFAGWGNVLTNFVSSVPIVAEGNSRGPVTIHGRLWRDIDRQAEQTLGSISSMCALTENLSSGGTPKDRISSIIMANRTLESYYWQVSLGENYNTPPENMEQYAPLIASIVRNYNFEATRSCKGNESSEKIEAAIKRLMESAGASGKKNEKSNQNWKDAIALFSGGDTKSSKYIETERRVLSAELARQGLTTNAKNAILGRLERRAGCLAQRIDDTSSPEDISKYQKECGYTLVAGLDTVTQQLKRFIGLSRTTDEYLARTLKYDSTKKRVSNDLGGVWTTLENELQISDQATNEKVINDLVDIHLKIVTINSSFDGESGAIKRMFKNCMKGNTGISCPQP